MDPISIIKFASLAKSVAEFIGIIESLNKKIDRLSEAELNAGIRTLIQADNSEHEKKALLRDARNYFNKAISLEKNYRLIIALTGLSLCHSYLGDNLNSKNIYLEIERTEFDINFFDSYLIKTKKAEDLMIYNIKSPFLKGTFRFLLKGLPNNPLSFLNIKEWRASFKEKEIKNYNNFKKESLKFLNNIIKENYK